MTAPAPILRCQGLSKRYGKKSVLQNIDLLLQRGEIYGLLGPNGAGKTTLIKIILGLSLPTRGSIEVFGLDLFRKRRQIIRDVGAIVEAPMFFTYLSAYENLHHLVSLTCPVPRPKILAALDAVGLSAVADAKVATFSYGMKQRLGIAQALLPETRLLLLDEPTNGLDPHGIAGMRQLLHRIARERNVTIMVSSHLLGEIEQLADRIGIIHHGEKILEASVAELQQIDAGILVEIAPGNPAAEGLAEQLGATIEKNGDNPVRLHFRKTTHPIPEIVRQLVALKADLHRVEPSRRSLEDIFLLNTEQGESDVRIDAF